MTREEYNEFRYIRSSLKKFTLGHGTTVTVRTDAGTDYKHRLPRREAPPLSGIR